MKKSIVFGVFMLLCFLIPAETLFADVEADINGSIQTDNRIRFDTQEFTRNDTRLTLKIEGAPSDYYHYFSEVQLKGIRAIEEDEEFRWEVDLREAYLDLYQFLSESLDVRIGKQIIAWGTADKLNPTSNVCPDDLEDMFNFGEKLGVNAMQASFYWGDVALAGIFVPEFVPAELPAGDLASAFASAMEPPEGMMFRNISQHTIKPERALDKSSQYAVKMSTMLFDYDVSLSYFYGRDDLPLVNNIIMTPVDTMGTVDLETDLIYSKMQVIGADFAGAISSVGIWAEGALFIHEKVDMTTFLETSDGLELQGESVALDDEPYFKYVVGMDYTFTNGWYINAQFLHGFFHERGKDDLHDYIVCRFEKDFLNDELTIAPFGVAIAIIDWDDIGNSYAIVGNPELTYNPTDNVELILGASIIEGKGENMFSQMKEQDQFYLKAKVSF